ncbi:hypothetical protein BO82DRAFT_19763 [Aspergillus uvarum CBS 121591]|uniref:Uncharacterized protein n=1 Tax=Aspergillus uvarum CBS 121591 TaxID=1448315 RepID=A0A319BVP3_9EURO|nr:hypothetical protein BO82DRAFT_19763 [Aspergillus uvarum CBS 121591]PYH75609.1 hypothetical protein BO82DRAFT_19763 [Aspergillus uvarum CBS 121591]
MGDSSAATPLRPRSLSSGEETPRPFSSLSATSQEILEACERWATELRATRRDLQHAQDELTSAKGVSDILFNLVEKMWALLCACRNGNDEKLSQSTLGVLLDAAIGHLDVQSLREAYERLRRENQQLRSLLAAATGQAEPC